MEEKKLTKEEIDQILIGKRPEGMDFEEFKVQRKALNKFIKSYVKNGRMQFVSSTIVEGKRVTKTYIKE